MALPHAASGEMIPLQRPEDDIANFTSIALVRTDTLELIRLVMPKDKEMPVHQVPGEVTLLCLHGELVCDAHGKSTSLRPGQMLYLLGGVPHGIRATEDAIGLLTILRKPGPAGPVNVAP